MSNEVIIAGKPLTHPDHFYAECVARGIPCHNHESDLYIPVTEETRALVKHYTNPPPGHHALARPETFQNQVEGGLWYDVPFAFTPWWEKREQEGKALEEARKRMQG